MFQSTVGALVLFGVACSSGGTATTGDAGGGDGATADGPGSTELSYKPCPSDRRVGGFAVNLNTGFTAVEGSVRSGIVPSDVWATDLQEGDCRILRGRSLFCTPSCSGTTTCAEGGTCIPYPLRASVGTVTIEGLVAPITLVANANTYMDAPNALPHPGFAEGASITLRSTGGDYAPFTLRGRGIAALTLPDGEIIVERDKPIALTWTPSTQAGPARIHVALDIAHHGGVAAELLCDVPDSGSFNIPATLATRLIDIGVAGFPTMSITRRTIDSTAIAPGCVDFVIASTRTRDVKVAGVVSCNDDVPCPDGKICQPNLTCP